MHAVLLHHTQKEVFSEIHVTLKPTLAAAVQHIKPANMDLKERNCLHHTAALTSSLAGQMTTPPSTLTSSNTHVHLEPFPPCMQVDMHNIDLCSHLIALC